MLPDYGTQIAGGRLWRVPGASLYFMEIMMKLKTVMAVVIAAAFAAPVLAQSPGRTTTDPKDSNPAAPPAAPGKVDRQAGKESAAGATAGGFSAMDRNSDGYISREEARDATWSNRFTELDKDNDGRLSQGEFSALGGAAGATADKDTRSPSTTGGMGGSVGPGGTQSGSSTSGIGDKPGQKQ